MANNQIPREIMGVMGDTNKNIQFTGSSRTYKDGTTSFTPANPAPKPETSSAFPSITYAQKGVPDTASVFKIARYYMDNGEQDRAGKAISGYTQFMRTAGSPYYQPYYTSFDPDEKYESATLEVEQALRDMYQDVRVAVAKGYSDAWIASNITSSKYKALKAADEAVTNGNPKKYTRQIPYLGADTVYGMIYQARNGDEYNSDIFSDVARYYMGYGKQYAPDDTEQAIRDRTSDKWNPYAFGGASASPTMNSLCGKYGVMGFTRDWAQKHADELEANGDREKVFKIIIATEKAEEEYKRLQENIIQRLRDGESVDDIYNTYFGNNMAYLKSGRKADVLDDGEEGYPTLHDMEYNRQMQGAIDLAWEVPFSSYGIKDWMTKTAAPMAKQLAEIDKFESAVPTDYQNDLLILYAQDKDKPTDWSVSNADMPDINAWVEEKGLSQKKLENGADYGEMLSAYARQQQQNIADRTEADVNFSASGFLSAINETDAEGNKTLEAATTNANFRLGLMSYYAGQPVTDQNAKSFINKYGWLLETDPESKAYLGGAVTVTGNRISAVDKLNAGATGYSWDNFGEIWKRAADTFDKDSDEWTDTVLAFADAYDRWEKDCAADFMNATTFTQFVERTPEVKASLEAVDENRKAYVKAQEEQRETQKANKAKYVMGLYNRANNGERIDDLNELAVWEQVQSISVNDYANGIYGQGYRTALDHMKEFGTSYLSEGASVFGTNDMFGRMESENELLCTIASESVDDLLRMAAFSGMSVDDFCKSQNIDLDKYVENAYMSAYSDYQTGLQAATDVAQSIKDVISGMTSREIDSLREGTEEIGIGRWEDHTQMLRNMVDRGLLTEQQFNAFERLYENGVDPDVISYGDKLLQRVMDGENVDVASAADAFLNANAETYAENLKDQRKGQRSAANDINVTGESGNFFDVALNGMKGGGLIFANSALTATLGWLGADRETYEGWIRGNYTREEYRQIIEDGINEKIDNPALREELIAQLRTYTGDIYKFNINYRTLGVQDAQADMSQRIAALDAEMAGVLSPSAYKWYKRSAGATNSFLMSVPVMVAAAATRGKSLEKYQGNVTLLAQLISSGYIEGGQTAYTLQQNGVDAGSSKIAGLMAGALTGYSEFAFEGAVNKLMPYKGGIVKSIENSTSINVGARALGVQKAIRDAGGGKFIASAAKWGTYGFLGAVNVGVQAFVGTGVEIAQEVQQTFTSALVANVYGEAMPEWEEYQQVISDTFYQSLIQGGVTGTVSQIQNTIQSNRANKRVISEQENALAGEQAVYMGALSSKQTQLNDLQKTLDAITEEREAGVRLMKDADSSARVQLRTVDLTVDEALKLHNSELVGNINSIQTENAQLEEMLAQFEESIDNANELYEQAEQEFMASEMPTDAEISNYNDAQRVLNAEISKRTQVQQRLDENRAKLAPMEQERRRQAQAIYDKAYQQAVEEEAQRRIAEDEEAEATKTADLEMLQQQKREEIAQTQKEIAEIREGYRNRLKEVRLQGLQRVADAGGLASERALDVAEQMFKELGGENEEIAIAKEAAMKENLKHQLELSFPGFKVSWADMGAYEDAAVVFMDDETGELRINSRAPVAAVMSGIMAHEISHIAEMSQEHFTPYWNAIVSAVYGTIEQVKQALQKEVEELRKRNPGISEDTTRPNNVFSVAQKEIAAKAIETILGAKNSAFTTGESSVYQVQWADALAKGDPLLGNNILEWLKLRAKELTKFAKANKSDKAVKAQYNNFARVANLLYDCLQDVANKNTRSAAERGAFIGNPADYNIGEPEAARTYAEREAPAARLAPEQTAQQEEVTLSDDDQREVDLFNEWVQEEQERLAEYGERIRKATDKLKKATTEKARQAAQKTIDSLQRASEKYEQAIADQKARIDEIKAKAREHFVQEQAQPVQKADETGDLTKTDKGFATAPARTETRTEQPVQKADEVTGDHVRTDTGFVTAPQQTQTEQQTQVTPKADEINEPTKTDKGYAKVPERTAQQPVQQTETVRMADETDEPVLTYEPDYVHKPNENDSREVLERKRQQIQSDISMYLEQVKYYSQKVKDAATRQARREAKKSLERAQRWLDYWHGQMNNVNEFINRHFVETPAQNETPVQPVPRHEETGDLVATDNGFVTVSQNAPEAPTAAEQTDEATTTQPEQTAQETPAEAPTEQEEEEAPYVETLDEDEDTEVEQEEQEQESEAPDTPAQGKPVASPNEYVAALQQGEHATLESGEELPMFGLDENGEFQQPDADVSPEAQAVLDAVQDAGLEAEHNANVADSTEPEAIMDNLTAYQIKESVRTMVESVKAEVDDMFDFNELSNRVDQMMAYTETIKQYAKSTLDSLSELPETVYEKMKPYLWQLEDLAENGITLQTERTEAPQLKQNQPPQTEQEKKLDDEDPASRTNKDLKSYRPYFNTHWDEFRYACEYAKQILSDLHNSTRGERIFQHNDRLGWTNTEVQGLTVFASKRTTSATIAAMLDNYKWSWGKIQEVLEKFIKAYETSTPLPNLNTIKRLETQICWDMQHGEMGSVEHGTKRNDLLYEGQQLAIAYLKKFHPDLLTYDNDGNVIAIGENLTVVGDYLRNKAPYELTPEEIEAEQKRQAKLEQLDFTDQIFSEYSRGLLARFNNSVLLNALQSQLEAARQSGNSAAYRRLAGRMLGIIRNATFDDTNKLNPVETLKRLADKIGSHIYEKVRMGAGEVSEYQEFARGILTNKAAATSFSALMENVGQAVLESAGATPDASGNVTLNGTSYTQAALNDMFLQWMATNDAAVAASRLLTQFQDNLQTALQNSEGGQERLDALTTARNDLNTYLSTQRGEQIAYFVRSLDAQQKETNGWLSKIYRTVVGETLDKTIYADIIDKATDYQSNVRQEVRYRPYGYGIASQLVDGRAFVDAHGNRVAGAETLASWLERAYDNFDDYGGQNAVYQRINQVLMIQSALDRMNRGQNPFSDSYVLAGTDIGRLVNPDKQMLTDALNRIQSIDPNALQAAENVRRWFKDVMQTFGVNENFLSQATLDEWNKRDPHYAPLLRFMNDTVDGGDELAGALGGSSLSSVIADNKGLQFKKAKGNSDRTVVNPIESMISMANVMVQKAVNNQAGRAFAKAFDLTPGLGGLAVELSPEQALAYKGGSGERLLAVQSEVTGQPTRYFLLNNPELYDLLVGTNRTNYNSLFARVARFLGHGTHMMTRLTTGANPLFAFKNMVRDFQRSVNHGSWASNYGSGAVKWVRAFSEVAWYKFRNELNDWFNGEDNVRVSQQLEDFITLGGEDYTRYGQGRNLDVRQVQRSLMGEGAARRTGRHLMNIVTFGSLNDAIEMASRYAEYKFGKNQTADSKGATVESKRAAFMASREATVDFAQGGDSTGVYIMRQLIPFLNATLQGKYQELRDFSGAERDRLGARLAKSITNNAIMGVLSYLLCTAFGGGYDDDDPDKANWVTALEEYNQISDSIKRDFLLLPFSALGAEGARDIVRVPLGHDFVSKVAYEMGRSAVENVMNAYYGKEASVSDWMGDFVMAGLDTIGELGDFTAITTPISSVMNNRSWTGNAIASDSMLSDGWSNAYNVSTWGGFRIGANIVNNLMEYMGVTDDRLRMLGTPVGQEYLFQQYTGIIGQLLIPALSKDSYTGEKAMPLQSIERVITNAWTLDAESSTDIPDTFTNCWKKIDTIVQSGNHRKGLGLLSANLTDEQVTMAHEEAKRLLSDNGELGQIKGEINELWGKYNSVMKDTSLSRKEREENAEPYRKEIVRLQEKGLAVGQQYFDKYDIEPSLLRGFVQAVQLNDRVVTPMTNAQRGNYDVSLNYGNVPDSYTQETQRLSDWYDAQTEDYKKQHGKTVSSKIYATPNLTFTRKKTKYDTADYPGAEDDVRTWYGEYYWQTYDMVVAGSKWQKADEEERIAMLSQIDTDANTYAQDQFLKQYVKPTLKGN